MRIGTFFDNPHPAPASPAAQAVPPPVPVDAKPLMGMALFDKAQRCKYDMLAGEAQQLTLKSKDYVIKGAVDAGFVNEVLVATKSLLAEIEAARKQQTKPFKDQAKSIEDQWRGHTASLEDLRTMLDRKLLIWTQAEQERIAREQAEARRLQDEAARKEAEAEAARLAALEAGDTARAEAAAVEIESASQAMTQARMAEPVDAPRGIRSDSGTSGLVENWTFKVVELDKVPREWLILDEQKVRAAVRGKNGLRNIPGLSIYAEQSLATRQRRS
jgi:hypothetical protein